MKISLKDIIAIPELRRNVYSSCCGDELFSISDGLFDNAWICETCHNIFQLQLVKIPKKKLTKEFMKQAIF